MHGSADRTVPFALAPRAVSRGLAPPGARWVPFEGGFAQRPDSHRAARARHREALRQSIGRLPCASDPVTSPSVDSDRRVNLPHHAAPQARRVAGRVHCSAKPTMRHAPHEAGRPFRARRAAAGEVDAVYDPHVPPPLAERMMKG